MPNFYARAIQILGDPDIDLKAPEILRKIAENQPSAVVYAVDGRPEPQPGLIETAQHPQLTHDSNDLEQRCRYLVSDHKKSKAIELYRNTMGGTYAAARKAVDDLATQG